MPAPRDEPARDLVELGRRYREYRDRADADRAHADRVRELEAENAGLRRLLAACRRQLLDEMGVRGDDE